MKDVTLEEALASVHLECFKTEYFVQQNENGKLFMAANCFLQETVSSVLRNTCHLTCPWQSRSGTAKRRPNRNSF